MGGTQSMLPSRMWTASREDSEMLAMKIRNYWFARGYSVTTEVFGLSELGESYPSGSHIYSVRSNMVGGYPSRDPAEPVKAAVQRLAVKATNPQHLMVRQ
jgi:hypothetical protein